MKWQTGVAIIVMLIGVLIAQAGSPDLGTGNGAGIVSEASAARPAVSVSGTPNRWLLVFALLVMTSAVTLDVVRGEASRAKSAQGDGEAVIPGDR